MKERACAVRNVLFWAKAINTLKTKTSLKVPTTPSGTHLARMSVSGFKRKLDADVLDVERMCSFKTDGIPRLLVASGEPTIMTRRRLLYVQETEGARPGVYNCRTLAGYPDRDLLSGYDDQEDGSFKHATFCSCVDMACDKTMVVLENNPVVVRVVDTKTETVKTLNLDLEPIQDPVCLECGPGNKLYISTRRTIYVASITSGKCRTFAPDVKFEEIQALCMDYRQRRLCVGDKGRVKFLSLEDGPETQVTEVALCKEDETATTITGLECDREGTVFVTRKTSDELVSIYTNKESRVQRVMHAENGIEGIALTGSGDLLCLALEGVEAHTEKMKYSVLRVKDGMPEPKHIPDRDLPLKRRMLETRIAHRMRQQQREELERDLSEGSCTVELHDDNSEARPKVNVNVRKLADTFDFFEAFERFPGNADNVRLEISGEVFRDMLEFCYTGTLEQKRHEMHDREFLLPRLAAANMLGGKLMLEYLEQAFVEAVTHQNALEMLALAETLPVQSLVKRMREHVEANSKEIACMSGGAHAEKLSHESLQALVKSMSGHLARSV